MSNDELMRQLQRITAMYRRGIPETEESSAMKDQLCHQGFGRVLSHLVRHGDGISQAALAERMHIRPQSLSESLGKMEERGFIRRYPNPQDKRGTLVYLTDEGRAQEEKLAERRRRAADSLLSALDEQEKQTLSTLLDKILNGRE